MPVDLIYGIHVLQRLLKTKPQQILEVFVVQSREDERIQEILLMCKQFNIAIHALSKKALDLRLSSANHQGIAARVRVPALLNEQDLIALLSTHANPLLLILDGVQDPHNLGASLRVADATGVIAVIIPKNKGVALTPVVRKVASGAAETIPLVQVTNLVCCLEALKERGIWVVGSSLYTKQTLYQVDLKGPLAIVLGAEGSGIRHLTEQHCDVLMHIPMLGMIESLNVSVAAGVCLYEATRQRLFT
jgi:23S rRNA (guanosine2251-2'-O)-methyltransferase